ncbi:MAG: dihydrodipicolinate reductase [Deltaproteobacteria bacterium]|jgi:4-hydroxy-tetrahydrodipicolinate reductase|nr:dihydrodipicolinate reductase [Deltaproteobacteria bacterium]
MEAINVGLLGFGKTGSIVAKELVNDKSLNLKWVCRRNIVPGFAHASHAVGHDDSFAPFVEAKQFSQEFLRKNPVDFVIDFSSNTASGLYELIASSGAKIVTAISKYDLSEMEKIKSASAKTAILYSPNITLGINWLIIASKVLKGIIPHADIEVVEEHFRAKKEVSGTALRIADHLNLTAKDHVNSIRVGGIVGKHEIIFGLPYQTIRLTHESISREAFGTGAIFAAKWLLNKPNGMYSMEQLFHEKFMKTIKELEF